MESVHQLDESGATTSVQPTDVSCDTLPRSASRGAEGAKHEDSGYLDDFLREINELRADLELDGSADVLSAYDALKTKLASPDFVGAMGEAAKRNAAKIHARAEAMGTDREGGPKPHLLSEYDKAIKEFLSEERHRLVETMRKDLDPK